MTWDLTLSLLLGGGRKPELPRATGATRHHLDPDELVSTDPLILTAGDIVAITGVSRQGAHKRLAYARATGDWSDVLAPSGEGTTGASTSTSTTTKGPR